MAIYCSENQNIICIYSKKYFAKYLTCIVFVSYICYNQVILFLFSLRFIRDKFDFFKSNLFTLKLKRVILFLFFFACYLYCVNSQIPQVFNCQAIKEQQ